MTVPFANAKTKDIFEMEEKTGRGDVEVQPKN
jgi:hypothetical protein